MASLAAPTFVRRLAGLAFPAVLAVCGCEARGAFRTVDFDARAGWRAGPGTHLRPDGRISLTRDGVGFVWKPVELDVDAYPVMLVRTGQSLPRFTWRVAVRSGHAAPVAPDEGIRLIERVAEEGHFVVPLKRLTGWTGRVRFVVLIALEGHARDWVEFADLQAVRLTAAAPPPPRLLAPGDGATVSPNAVHLSFAQAKNAVAYDLQISRGRDFAGARSVRVTPPYLADRLPYLPEDESLRTPGHWFWRVRAVSVADRAGRWSTARSYAVREEAPPKPPELTVAPEHPLVLLLADRRTLSARWRSLPSTLRPYVVLRVEELPVESLLVTLAAAQRLGVPVMVQASGPHDYYGPVASRIPLSDLETIFGRFPVVKGVYICEQAFRVSPDGDRIMKQYARQLVALAAEYGKLVVWADGHWGRNLWIDVGLDAPLANALRAHRRYFVPVWKMNGALTPHAAHDAVLGLWMAGFADHWGVQPERWYWYEAGLGALGRQQWFKEGEMADFPPTFYGQMTLLGLVEGATVYSFEPGDDVWTAAGELSPTARGVLLPLLEAIVRRRLIAGREEVVRRARTVYVADSSDSHWALDYGTLRPLYQAAYGATTPFAMLPAQTRYRRIPIVPPGTPPATLALFPDRVHAGEFAAATDARRHLDARYPARNEGDAWVGRIPGGVAVMNGHENRDIDERFDVTLEGPVRRVAGRIGVNGYVALQQREGEAWLHANARPGRTVALDLWAAHEPAAIAATPRSALVRSVWNPSERHLTLTLLPGGAAVDVVLGFRAPAPPPRGGR